MIYWSTLLNNEAVIEFSKAFYNHLGASMDDSEDFQGGFDAAVEFLEESQWKLEDPVNPYTEVGTVTQYRRDRAGIPYIRGAKIISAADVADGMIIDDPNM